MAYENHFSPLLDLFLESGEYMQEMGGVTDLCDFPDADQTADDTQPNFPAQTSESTQLHTIAPLSGFTQLTSTLSYESTSPPLSTLSTGSGNVFNFPTPAPTPEAALPLAESLAESPNIDVSLFGPPNAVIFNQNCGILKSSTDDVDIMDAVEVRPTEPAKAVKQELATHIRQRRRASGLGDVEADDEENKSENVQLTKADLVRRERRKASNRRAATKCRLKKKAAEEQMSNAMTKLREENERLRQEVITLTGNRKALEEKFKEHLALCTHRR